MVSALLCALCFVFPSHISSIYATYTCMPRSRKNVLYYIVDGHTQSIIFYLCNCRPSLKESRPWLEFSFSLRNPPVCAFSPRAQTRVQHSPRPSTIELPSDLAEYGAYLPDRAYHGTFCVQPSPYGHRNEFGNGPPGKHHFQATNPSLCLKRPAETRRQPVVASLEARSSPTRAGKRTLTYSFPNTRFWREKARYIYIYIYICAYWTVDDAHFC